MGWQRVFGDGVFQGLSNYSGLIVFTFPILRAKLFPVLLPFWGEVYEVPILYPPCLPLPKPGTP